MTKTEILKQLSDASIEGRLERSLASQIDLLMDLKALPEAIALETVKALEPLEDLRQSVQQVLKAYDAVTAAQRQALDELTQEMTARATEAFKQKVKEMDAKIGSLGQAIRSLEQATSQIRALPSQLEKAAESMEEAASSLKAEAEQARARPWQQVLVPLTSAIVGGLLVTIGQVALNKHQPPDDAVLKRAEWARVLLSKATQEEKKLIQQIVSRPAK